MGKKGKMVLPWANCTKIFKIWSTFQLTHISIEDGDSFAADLFVCTNMLVDTPVTPPSTAYTPLASVQAKE